MYNFLKSILKTIISKEVLIKNESTFRMLTKPLYAGTNNECNVCGSKLRKFAKLENGELICPICGSIPRARRLYGMLMDEYLKPNTNVLDFSPFRILYRKLKERDDFNYFPSDYEGDFLSDYHFDITNIEIEDNKFDLIICYHILEHIIEDKLAMSELYRVLNNGGIVLIQTPFKEGNILEDYSITTPEARLKLFGQDNHVRIYSLEGLENRLKETGFRTEVKILEADDYHGLSAGEKVIICRK